MTTNPVDAPLTRLVVEATAATGLAEPSSIIVDKITTMPRDNVRDHLGRLSDADLLRLNRAIVTFLVIATAT